MGKNPYKCRSRSKRLADTIQKELDKTTKETISVGGFPKLAIQIMKRFEEDPSEASRRNIQASLNLLRDRKQVTPPDREKGDFFEQKKFFFNFFRENFF